MNTPEDSKLKAQANLIGTRLRSLEVEIHEESYGMHVVLCWYRGDTPEDSEILKVVAEFPGWWYGFEGLPRVGSRRMSRKYHRTVEVLSIDYSYEGTWSAGVFTRAVH